MRTLAVTTASLLGILWVALGVQDVDVLWGLSKAATAPKKVEVAKEQKPKVSLDALDPKLEKQLEQISGAKMTLETQRLALESMNINQAALEAQRAGARAMRRRGVRAFVAARCPSTHAVAHGCRHDVL